MKDEEKRISDYIDALNEEQQNKSEAIESGKLINTAELLRGLVRIEMPEQGFEKRLAYEVTGRLAEKRPSSRRKKIFSFAAIGMAAVLIAVILLNVIPLTGFNLASAMEKAFSGIKAYHGTLKVQVINSLGDVSTLEKLEVWADKDGHYYSKELEGQQAGLITVSNGREKWQIQPELKLVQLFPAFPDPYRFTFELGKEIESTKSAVSVQDAGRDVISGRAAEVFNVTPQGGTTYRIWIDRETRLPLQKESALQNAVQYRITYTEIEFTDAIPQDLLTYLKPEGYQEIDTNPVQIFVSIDEVQAAAGFVPLVPQNVPGGYVRDYLAVRPEGRIIQMNFVSVDNRKRIIILEGIKDGDFIPSSNAILGTVGQSVAEIQSPVHDQPGILGSGGPYAGITDITSIRWRNGGFEYAVVGNTSFDDLADFVKGMTGENVSIPAPDVLQADKPKADVPVNMEEEANEQKSVDAGHSPWRLDPLFVTQVFVSLQISPEGITGDYPIHEQDLKLVKNDGVNAVVEISGNVTPTRKVYLKRLVRQDSTGIWTVVGYDPVE